eukprot:1139201-Pelagomonas_calceolata.AAC.6
MMKSRSSVLWLYTQPTCSTPRSEQGLLVGWDAGRGSQQACQADTAHVPWVCEVKGLCST